MSSPAAVTFPKPSTGSADHPRAPFCNTADRRGQRPVAPEIDTYCAHERRVAGPKSREPRRSGFCGSGRIGQYSAEIADWVTWGDECASTKCQPDDDASAGSSESSKWPRSSS